MILSLTWRILPWVCKAFHLWTKLKPTPPIFLIVEDNPDDAELLSYTLSRRGISTEVAKDGYVAKALIRHKFYPVVFVDLRLPGMSGAQLLQVLSRETPNSQSVVVCGETYDLETVQPSKFLCVIRKPPTLDAIEEMLQKLKI